MRDALLKSALDVLRCSGATRLLARACAGIGAIFMLHHVRPAGRASGFRPNAGLEVTPAFLDAAIGFVRAKGYQPVSFAEAVQRIRAGTRSRPFAVFTLDDGYLDNFTEAWPVFRRQGCPFTIFLATGIVDGSVELWWLGLEAVIAAKPWVDAEIGGERLILDTSTDHGKRRSFARLYWPVRRLPEHEQRSWIRGFCGRHGVDLDRLCRQHAMSWEQVREIARDPLCSIGAHTRGHFAIARLPEAEARAEIGGSAARIEREIGIRPRYFAYPYGDPASAGARDFVLAREAGFEAAVTTRKGLVFPEHAGRLEALPRVSLNGGYQHVRHVDALLSGVPFLLFNRFRRIAA